MVSTELQRVKGQGWTRGLSNLLKSEIKSWWCTKKWWIQLLIWVGTIDLITGWSMMRMTNMEDLLLTFLVFSAIPVLSVIIITQNLIIGEKISGTAHWILSKPISRPAFIIAKFTGNLIGVLVTMVLVPSGIMYIEIYAFLKSWMPLSRFIPGVLMIVLFLLFFLALTLMLSTVFSQRGPVIGVPIGFIVFQFFIASTVPATLKFLPWGLIVSSGGEDRGNINQSIGMSFMLGQQPEYTLPIVITSIAIVLFLAIAVIRFRREEL